MLKNRPFSIGLLTLTVGFAAIVQQTWPPAPPLPIPNETDPGPLPPSITAQSAGGCRWQCTFRFKPDGLVQSIVLAGSFNNWSRDTNPMTGPDEHGFWSATVLLTAGTYPYKFVVYGDRWHADPQNPDTADDGHGGRNSVLKLGRLAHWESSPAKRGDGKIEPLGLKHDNRDSMYFQRTTRDRFLVRFRTLADDVDEMQLVVMDGQTVPMQVILEEDLFAFYEAEAAVPRAIDPEGKLVERNIVQYTFVLKDGDLRVTDFPAMYMRGLTEDMLFETPEWAKHAVWYQIMVDRFRNGSSANDPTPVRPWTSEWFNPSPWEAQSSETFYKWFVFHRLYGGDLQGVEEKLPYLKDLGINAIYFNPVFKAPSHHKYDATNYLHIDDHFGTKGDYDAAVASENLLDTSTWQWTDSDMLFLRVIQKAHAMGIRIIIDGVFNHVGTDHPAFQDVKTRGKESPYADWFDVTSWEPFKYQGWAGYDALPVFKKSAEGLASATCKAHIFNVTRRWMDPNGDGDPSDGIDGWRLDVPNEIPMPFWAEWRTLVKSINPNAYIVGEIWDHAETWLDGKHFDAVMNYPFARAAVSWIFDRRQKITATEVDRRLRQLRLAYPTAANYVLQNLVDSHDTDREVSMAQNPDRTYDRMNRVQDDNPKYDNSKPSPEAYARARLMALLQMTYIGAPMIYYGDEVGMWGADDPTCRKPMLWEDLQPYENPEFNFVMKDHLEFYKSVISLRNTHPALRTGALRTLYTDDRADVWAFWRGDENEQFVVVLNASNSAATITVPFPSDSPVAWDTVFGSRTEHGLQTDGDRIQITVPPIAGLVLRAKSK